jgi:hypothetical protein
MYGRGVAASSAAMAGAGPALASTGFSALGWLLTAVALLVAGLALVRGTLFGRPFLPSKK